ncbi:MAG: hypothetical protein AB1679_10050 [Actinomycetota bacterium]|jgi:hypothetical protein
MALMKSKWAAAVVALAASLMVGGAALPFPPSSVEGSGHGDGLPHLALGGPVFPGPIEDTRDGASHAIREAQRRAGK